MPQTYLPQSPVDDLPGRGYPAFAIDAGGAAAEILHWDHQAFLYGIVLSMRSLNSALVLPDRQRS